MDSPLPNGWLLSAAHWCVLHAGSEGETPAGSACQLGAPAGLGKTTLAHVAAQHCGYRPVEINASDERTAATLRARVADAVQMTAVLGARRPNCVVIDEIDGATGAPRAGLDAPFRQPSFLGLL
jgi:chromosome transmission fidelity protein 18